LPPTAGCGADSRPLPAIDPGSIGDPASRVYHIIVFLQRAGSAFCRIGELSGHPAALVATDWLP
jgi:hypothetical protein